MSITTIQELIDSLDQNPIDSFPSILKSIAIPLVDFEAYSRWYSHEYTRNCIVRNERYELLLLCWSPHHETAIHDHNGQKCWVYQIKGQIEEQRYESSDKGPVPTRHSILKEGVLSYMDDKMGLHLLSNPSDERAMSLHIYVAPIDKCKVYNEEDQCFVTKQLSYDETISTSS